ncbi:plasmid stabilization protein [Streptomyces sp. NPDC127106]|uniref:plasmid stabilization protein n=1 Tax=Streptomyces sp. NPDC127106 TaxID=3345360 RepID=UPI00362BAA3E
MPRGSSPQREDHDEHIKESAEERGVPGDEAANRLSLDDLSPSRRGGPSDPGADGPTHAQLYEEARQRNIRGRSEMTKAQLKRALGK